MTARLLSQKTLSDRSSPSGLLISGGIETTYTGDGTNGTILGQRYAVHSLLSSSTLTIVRNPLRQAVDLLLAGGGGGGGASYGAAGGAGAFIELLGLLLGEGAYAVTIGPGGAGAGGPGPGVSGSDSVLAWPIGVGQPLIARGGGAAGYQFQAGTQGGCGGGGGNTNAGGQSIQSLGYYSAGATGAGTAGCGGGGGAGGAGTAAQGGPGRQSSLRTGQPVYYCASGQPEGAGVSPGTGYVNADNTGNGGSAGTAGNSGLLVVRYKI